MLSESGQQPDQLTHSTEWKWSTSGVYKCHFTENTAQRCESPPLHCWVNRSQLSEDWLLWSQASDILHLNAESITIKMARLVHAQTQHL